LKNRDKIYFSFVARLISRPGCLLAPQFQFSAGDLCRHFELPWFAHQQAPRLRSEACQQLQDILSLSFKRGR